MTKMMLVLAMVGMALTLTLVGCKGEAKTQEQLDKEAQSIIKDVEKCISDKGFDDAEKHLKKLEANKGKYSDALQKQIDGLRTTLDAAKKTKLPKLPI